MHRKGLERNCAGYGAKKQKGEKSLEAAGGVCENGDGEDNSSGRMNLMTLIILLCVVCGLVFGHFGVPHFFTDMEAFGALAGSLINIGLCVLLFFVGFDMGVDAVSYTHLDVYKRQQAKNRSRASTRTNVYP